MTELQAARNKKIKAANLKHALFMKARMQDKQALTDYVAYLDKGVK